MFERLVTPIFFTGGHHQLLKEGFPKECLHYTLKAHSGLADNLFTIRQKLNCPITRIITFVRNQGEIYLSAYFQDIDNPELPYFFGTRSEILNTPTEILSRHFLGFDWPKFEHLQINWNISEVSAYTGIDYSRNWNALHEFGFNVCGHKSFNGEPVILGVAHVNILKQHSSFLEFLKELQFPWYVRKQIPLGLSANVGSKKWYASKYREMQLDPQVVNAVLGWNTPYSF